ncbi:MAG: FkbM family methyltransferase, partial [Verrucomicrobia bacterium]|nr:FkbM family methyltransferase [Verrucomicrobiota bacterium]
MLRPGETMVDVGANIGAMSLEAARILGPQGVIHAVEPHPKTASYLKANLKLNQADQVQCHIVALGAESGLSSMTNDRRDDMNYLKSSSHNDPHDLPVRITTLDLLLPSLPHCHLLKIDVEGRELDCVLGARRTLEHTDVLLVEAGDPNSSRFGTTAADLHQKLEQSGFQIFAWEQGRLEPVRLAKY